MAPRDQTKKRKAITRDGPAADEVVLSDGGGDLEASFLDGILSQSEDGASEASDSNESVVDGESDESSEEFGGSLDSDEVPSDADADAGKNSKPLLNGSAETNHKLAEEDEEDGDPPPKYVITEDANGNPRYVYQDIDP
ncbi:MAG: hypothetical protein Q9224_005572, partial [Gallowayella concinna]